MNIMPIHTLDARDNVMLEVMKSHFQLTPIQIFGEIQGARSYLEDLLAKKNIEYGKLRTALVPGRKKREIALVFDTSRTSNLWYGHEVFEAIIPALHPKSNHSVLHGDFIGSDDHQPILRAAFNQAITLDRPVSFKHSSQFYIVYINNVSTEMVDVLRKSVSVVPSYVGCADVTFASAFKVIISTQLVNVCLKYGRTILQGHPEDEDDSADLNMCGFPFEEAEYTCKSIRSDLYNLFLSYKIERPVTSGFLADTSFSLNAVSSSPLPLADFEVEVSESKIAYLRDQKASSLSGAGLEHVTAKLVAEIVRQKVNSNYIYNLTCDEEHKTVKFNIMIELLDSTDSNPKKLLASLEYLEQDKRLRLITLF